jgi:hypothetical protein
MRNWRIYAVSSKYCMKTLLRFQCRSVERRYFQTAFKNASLHEIINDNSVGVVSFTTSKNLIVKSTLFHIAAFVNTLELSLMGRHTARQIMS